MDVRWRNSVVAIVASKKGGGSKTGTGVLVASDLVLTAAHVVAFEGATGPVRLRWKSNCQEFGSTSGDKGNGFHDALCDENPRGIAWSCPDLDLALITCLKPPEVESVEISDNAPRDGVDWAGDAYPAICEDRFEDSKYLSGAMSSLEHIGKASRFALASNQVLRDDGEQKIDVAQWSGASGMPVVRVSPHYSPSVIGVLTTEHTLFDSSFDATPVCEALKDPDFRLLLGLQEPETAALLRKQLVEAAAAFLKVDAARIQMRSLDFFPQECVDDLTGETLTAALIGAEESDAFREALYGLWRSLDHPRSNEALKLVTALLVYRFARDNGAKLAFCGGALASVVLCDSLVGVEVAMAGYHERDVRFRKRRGPDDRPAGELCLEPPPEIGRGVINTPSQIDWSGRIGTDIVAGLERRGRRTKHQKAFLRNQARVGRKYYAAYPVENPTDLAEHVDAACRALCAEKGWPEICVVLFDPDDGACNDEERFGFMCEMLPLEGEQGDSS